MQLQQAPLLLDGVLVMQLRSALIFLKLQQMVALLLLLLLLLILQVRIILLQLVEI